MNFQKNNFYVKLFKNLYNTIYIEMFFFEWLWKSICQAFANQSNVDQSNDNELNVSIHEEVQLENDSNYYDHHIEYDGDVDETKSTNSENNSESEEELTVIPNTQDNDFTPFSLNPLTAPPMVPDDLIDESIPEPEPESQPNNELGLISERLIRYDCPQSTYMDITSSKDGKYIYTVSLNDYLYMTKNNGITWNKVGEDRPYPWTSISCSSSGKKVLAVRGDNQASYISNDYGETWSWIKYPSGYLYDSDMSSDGQYIISTIHTPDSRFWTGVWTSNDGGENWTRPLNANVQWSSVSISSSGEYGLIFVSGFNGHSRENRGIWVSSDYCSTFNKKIYLSSGDYHNDVDISDDGKCMVVASKDLGVYVSLDYGENWNQKYNPLPSVLWRGVSINSKGYIVAVDMIRKINEAYEVLGDKFKRSQYDMQMNGMGIFGGLGGLGGIFQGKNMGNNVEVHNMDVL